MAITIVASVIGTVASGANVTLALAGAAENDVVVTFGGFAGGTATAPGVISPSGYTSVWVVDNANNDFKVEWKRLGATVDPSVLLRGSGNAADPTTYGAYVLRGVTTASNPLDVVIKTSIANGVPDAPSIVTATAGAVVLALAGNDINDTTPGTVTNFNANVGTSSNDTDDFTAAGAVSVLSTAGSINPAAWSTWASGNYAAITLALAPEPDPVPNPDPFQSYVGSYAALPPTLRGLKY